MAGIAFTVVASVPAAAATGPGNETGGDVSLGALQQTAAEAAQTAEKSALAKSWQQLKLGKTDKAGFDKKLADWQSRSGIRGDAAASPQTSSAKMSAATATTASTASKSLSVAHVAQSNSFYCGPASGYMVLKTLGRTYSAYSPGNMLDGQKDLAHSWYMQTDDLGKTPWAQHLWRIGVNRWNTGADTGWYVDLATPTTAEFKANLLFDIDWDHPFGVSTVEYKGGVHYNGHPADRLIGHWITAQGYSDGGNTASFDDPATSVWSGVSANFTYSSSSFTTRFLQTNGITW
ncbi:MAG: C39 family peptidase [Sporichthyaceae bacterium]